MDINPDLNDVERLQVEQLIEEFQDIFTDRPRVTNLGEHEMNLAAAEPIRSKPYPLPHAMRAQLSSEIDSMLSMDIIEKSNASYSSPVVIVKKSDNSVRVCCDYRKLNRISVFDPEPMPTADDIFVKLSGNRYFSKLKSFLKKFLSRLSLVKSRTIVHKAKDSGFKDKAKDLSHKAKAKDRLKICP